MTTATEITEQMKVATIARLTEIKAEVGVLAKELEQAFGINPDQGMMNGFIFAKLAEIRIGLKALNQRPVKISVVKKEKKGGKKAK